MATSNEIHFNGNSGRLRRGEACGVEGAGLKVRVPQDVRDGLQRGARVVATKARVCAPRQSAHRRGRRPAPSPRKSKDEGAPPHPRASHRCPPSFTASPANWFFVFTELSKNIVRSSSWASILMPPSSLILQRLSNGFAIEWVGRFRRFRFLRRRHAGSFAI